MAEDGVIGSVKWRHQIGQEILEGTHNRGVLFGVVA